MSIFSGKAGKGAMRTYREVKKAEAILRQASFDTDVREAARLNNISEREARGLLTADHSARRGH